MGAYQYGVWKVLGHREMKTKKLCDFFPTLAPSVVDFYKTL